MIEHKNLGGEVSLSGRLVAAKVVPNLERTDTESISLHEKLVAELANGTGELVAVRIADDRAHSVAADLTDDGAMILRISGPPSYGEDGVVRASQALVSHLNAQGGAWGEVENVSKDRLKQHIDTEAKGEGRAVLRMQVVRADITESLWLELSSSGKVDVRLEVAEVADRVLGAIDRKRLRANPNVVLVLDAGLVASHALDRVVTLVRAKMASLPELAGFQSVWLVGPTDRMVRRLDGKEE